MTGFEHTLPLFGLAFLPFIAVVVLWTIAIKGVALWYSARNGQKVWFIAMLFVNLIGIPEVIYLLWFRADKKGIVAPSALRSSEPKESDDTEKA